jgi:exodeoxyribonuclease V beta subunit
VLQQWMGDVLAAQLQPGLALRDIHSSRCLAEMEFLLPVAELDANRLNRLLQQHDGLSAMAPPLSFATLQGMLKGFMDLVFEHQGRFYVLDYKSNHLGNSAADYGPEALQQAMVQHRYDLQYQLYTLALHRYLSTRLPDYDYERHLGGVFYLFLRGMQSDSQQGIFFTRPAPELISALDGLFAGEVSV